MSNPSIELARAIVDTLEEKKGEDILLLDLTGVCSFTDLFVIGSARSDRTLKALSNEVQRRMKSERDTYPLQVEGEASSGWVLLDYGPVILHLFSPELRRYYALEELWEKGKVVLRIA